MKDNVMMTRADTPSTQTTLLWSAILGTSAIFGSYAFACIFPFAALATIAALTLRTRRAAGLVGVVWLVNQVVGFGFRGYPHTMDSVGWGIAIGVGAFGALVAARLVVGTSPRILSPRTPVALLAAFIAYEVLLFAYALVAGGLDTFAPDIVAGIGMTDLIWFVALAGLHLALTYAAPDRFPAATAAGNR